MQPTTETRTFRLHPNIIHHIINSQTGSLSKAIGEYVQNSMDAGATRIDIKLDGRGWIVTDDGKGFIDRREIESFFEEFGRPHDDSDSATCLGRFRIGRGQGFAYATTYWRSGRFEMQVDIRNRGLDYALVEHDSQVYSGCEIQGSLYEPLLPSELDNTIRELKQLASYVSIPVFLNSESISTPPSTTSWDVENDDAFIRLRGTGSLKVYNLGIFVMEVPLFRFGTGGVVVSKLPLRVNFARNAVLDSACPIWKRIVPLIKQRAQKKNLQTARLNDETRLSLAGQFRHGELLFEAFQKLNIFRDVHGRYHNVQKLIYGRGLPITLAPSDRDPVGKAVHDRRLAFVLSPKTLEFFEVDTINELIEVLATRTSYEHTANYLRQIKIVPFDDVKAHVGGDYVVLKDTEIAPQELCALRAIRKSIHQLAPIVRNALNLTNTGARMVRAGRSDVALSWTDGSQFVALQDGVLRECRNGLGGFMAIMTLLANQMMFDKSSENGEQMEADRLELFHALMTGNGLMELTNVAVSCFTIYLSELRSGGHSINKSALLDHDTVTSHEWMSENPPESNVKPN